MVDALVAAGELTPDEATTYGYAAAAMPTSGQLLLKNLVRALLKDRRRDAAYLDRVCKALIARHSASTTLGSASMIVLYHPAGARALPGFSHVALQYEKKADRAHYKAERAAFDRQHRKAWVKDIAVTQRDQLLGAGLTEAQVATMARYGRVPDNYDVHHRLPLDDGGTNTPSNYLLLRSDIEHRALHGYYNPAELRVRLLAPGEQALVAFPQPPRDTVIYPNPALGYEARSVAYSDFLEVFDVD
ncbi:MAG: HNH endonuclease signature motif containing protein [Burkholderiales bacterium]